MMGVKRENLRRLLRGAGLPAEYATQGPAWQKAHRRAVRAYYDRHKAAGLCVRCPAPATAGSLCERHAEQKRRGERLRYARRKRLGLCAECGKLRSPLSAQWCDRHAEANRRRSTQRNRRKGVPESTRGPSACHRCGGRGHDARNCQLKAGR